MLNSAYIRCTPIETFNRIDRKIKLTKVVLDTKTRIA